MYNFKKRFAYAEMIMNNTTTGNAGTLPVGLDN